MTLNFPLFWRGLIHPATTLFAMVLALLAFLALPMGISLPGVRRGAPPVAVAPVKKPAKVVPVVHSYRSPLVPRPARTASHPVPAQPNIILINLDDADRDCLEIDFHRNLPEPLLPNIKALANDGFRFSNCHCAVPICGPSRACLLTGQYAYKTGIRCNSPGDPMSRGVGGGYLPFRFQGPFESNERVYVNNELGFWMRSAGYNTMLVGKYLHDGFSPLPGETWEDIIPPGWERFFPSLGSRYFNTFMMKDQVFTSADQLDPLTYPNTYRTSVESVDARQLIREHEAAQDGRPFFMYLAPLAPHVEALDQRDVTETLPEKGMVEPRYKSSLPNLKQIRAADFDEADMSDKPETMANLARLQSEGNSYYQNDVLASDMEFRRRVLSMKSVDDMLAGILATLRELQMDQDTIIILTSDHGYALGQHRHFGKAVPYDRVSNVPLIVWGPGYFDQGPDYLTHLISQIDLAPTILEMAGSPIPEEVQGKSFLPLLDGSDRAPASQWRPEGVLVEHWERVFNRRQQTVESTFQSVRFHDSVYTEWANGDREFYKLTNDPYQLLNKFDLIPESFKTVLGNRMALLKRDMPAPKTHYESPINNQAVFYQSADLSGIAEFSQDIKEVRLVISDITDPAKIRFWNGSQWTVDRQNVRAAIDSNDCVITNWRYHFDPKPDQERRYRVVARAISKSGAVEQRVTFRDFSIDIDQPVSRIELPPADQTEKYFSALELSGTAEDDLGIRAVRVALMNSATGKFWNGNAWQPNYIMINSQLDWFGATEVRWTLQFSPPEDHGSAVAYVRAVSMDGRFDTKPRIHRFQWAR